MSNLTLISGDDYTWRWQTGGIECLSVSQRHEANKSFDDWLRGNGSYKIGVFRVDTISEYVSALQNMPDRPCGLEGWKPELVATNAKAAAGARKSQAESALRAIVDTHKRFLDAYKAYDAHFVCLREGGDLYVPLDLSYQALELDRAAWRLTSALMQGISTAQASGHRLTGARIKDVMLVDRTARYVRTIMMPPRHSILPPPSCPAAKSPEAMGDEEAEELRFWISHYADMDDAFRRMQAAKTVRPRERSKMMRWLQGVGLMDDFYRQADTADLPMSVTGYTLTEINRSDLRRLKKEFNGFRSLTVDVEAQKKVLSEINDDEQAKLRAEKILRRLEEMRGHSRSRAKFFWVNSFHFNRDAQAEAESIAPRLIAAAREELAGDITEQSGRVGKTLKEMTEDEVEAVANMALAVGDAVEAGAVPVGYKRPHNSKDLMSRVATAAHAVGSSILSRMKTGLPEVIKAVVGMSLEVRKTPIEKLADEVGDWRLHGIAAAERRMREGAGDETREVARETMLGYAASVVDDKELMAKVSTSNPNMAAWLKQVSGIGKAEDAERESENLVTGPKI